MKPWLGVTQDEYGIAGGERLTDQPFVSKVQRTEFAHNQSSAKAAR
jgi:hypothetical protein